MNVTEVPVKDQEDPGGLGKKLYPKKDLLKLTVKYCTEHSQSNSLEFFTHVQNPLLVAYPAEEIDQQADFTTDFHYN